MLIPIQLPEAEVLPVGDGPGGDGLLAREQKCIDEEGLRRIGFLFWSSRDEDACKTHIEDELKWKADTNNFVVFG